MTFYDTEELPNPINGKIIIETYNESGDVQVWLVHKQISLRKSLSEFPIKRDGYGMHTRYCGSCQLCGDEFIPTHEIGNGAFLVDFPDEVSQHVDVEIKLKTKSRSGYFCKSCISIFNDVVQLLAERNQESVITTQI